MRKDLNKITAALRRKGLNRAAEEVEKVLGQMKGDWRKRAQKDKERLASEKKFPYLSVRPNRYKEVHDIEDLEQLWSILDETDRRYVQQRMGYREVTDDMIFNELEDIKESTAYNYITRYLDMNYDWLRNGLK